MANRPTTRIRESRHTVQPIIPAGESRPDLEDDLYDTEFDADEVEESESHDTLTKLKLPLTVLSDRQAPKPNVESVVNPTTTSSVIRSLISEPANLQPPSAEKSRSLLSTSQFGPVGHFSRSKPLFSSPFVVQAAQQTLPPIRCHPTPTVRTVSDPVKRPRGRPRKHPISSFGSDVNTPKQRSQVENKKTIEEPPSILLPLQKFHAPTDETQPLLRLCSEHDPLASLDDENVPNMEAKKTAPTASSLLSSCGRMKSSGLDKDIDIQELDNYRRLNGYTLFVMLNKRKYVNGPTSTVDEGPEPSEGMSGTQKDNRRWQAIWSTLPEKVRKQWKARAKRLFNQQRQRKAKLSVNRERRLADRRRLENQLAKAETVSTGLTDLAAYFQLLSESFASMAEKVQKHQGPVDVDSVLSTLLDGLLTCLIPLLALASEEELLSSAPNKEDISKALKQLTYIIPL